MSNDLISRKAFYAGVEATRDSWSASPYVNSDDMRLYRHVFNDILEFISKFPTAFDTEKVIEELRNKAEISKEFWKDFDDEEAFGEMNAFNKAIEIVEKGGIE